jgi:hypothetical protein
MKGRMIALLVCMLMIAGAVSLVSGTASKEKTSQSPPDWAKGSITGFWGPNIIFTLLPTHLSPKNGAIKGYYQEKGIGKITLEGLSMDESISWWNLNGYVFGPIMIGKIYTQEWGERGFVSIGFHTSNYFHRSITGIGNGPLISVTGEYS